MIEIWIVLVTKEIHVYNMTLVYVKLDFAI